MSDDIMAMGGFTKKADGKYAKIGCGGKYQHLKVKLAVADGNAFALMGKVAQALRRDGASKEEIDQFHEEATSGDYNHLLSVCMAWVDVR